MPCHSCSRLFAGLFFSRAGRFANLRCGASRTTKDLTTSPVAAARKHYRRSSSRTSSSHPGATAGRALLTVRAAGGNCPAPPLSRSRLHRLVQKRNGPILWLLLGRGVAGPEQNSLQPSLFSKGASQT